jgi:soluble lytic murein transglycosylase-like protein
MTYKPLIETEIKPPDAPKTHLRHKVNIYIPPTGKTLKIAEKVSKETGVPCETISKIMYFESSYNPKIVGVNKNKTRDIGLFQINSIHLAEAKKMGLNLKDPDDNATFAIHLIKQNGLRDWYSSKKNWES